MNFENVINIFDVINVVMTVGIIIVYAFASYWNIKFLLNTKKQTYTWIKIYTATMCIIFVLIHIFYLYKIIIGSALGFSLFELAFIRPPVFLMGGALASSSRARYISLLSGGEGWTMRKTS
jgi:hypothetical protein